MLYTLPSKSPYIIIESPTEKSLITFDIDGCGASTTSIFSFNLSTRVFGGLRGRLLTILCDFSIQISIFLFDSVGALFVSYWKGNCKDTVSVMFSGGLNESAI